MKLLVTGLVIGLAVGIAGATLLPRYLSPHLPSFMRGDAEPVEGLVEAKRLEDDRLLLTIRTSHGSTLATFRKKCSEIDLLVEAGDTVTFDLSEYRPFVEDPTIRRVVKPDDLPDHGDPDPGDPWQHSEQSSS